MDLLLYLTLAADVWIFCCFASMKKLAEPPMPATFWPHALLQMTLFVVYMLVLEPKGIFPTLQMRAGELEQSVGWWLPFVMWVVFVFLLGEMTTRLTQRWAANAFPFQRGAFLAMSMLLAVPMLYLVSVAWECILYFVAMGRYPVQMGRVGFAEGFRTMVVFDWPWGIVVVAGELLRHWIYAGWIRKWHHERGLRLLPVAEDEA